MPGNGLLCEWRSRFRRRHEPHLGAAVRSPHRALVRSEGYLRPYYMIYVPYLSYPQCFADNADKLKWPCLTS